MPVQKVANINTYLFCMSFESEVASIVEVNNGIRNIAFPGFSARRYEKGIMFSPDG